MKYSVIHARGGKLFHVIDVEAKSVHFTEDARVSFVLPHEYGPFTICLEYKPFRIGLAADGGLWIVGHDSDSAKDVPTIWPIGEPITTDLAEPEEAEAVA